MMKLMIKILNENCIYKHIYAHNCKCIISTYEYVNINIYIYIYIYKISPLMPLD